MATLATDALMLIAVASGAMLLWPTTSPAAIAAYPPVVILLLAGARRYRPRLARAMPAELRDSVGAAAIGALVVSASSDALGRGTLTGEEVLRLWSFAVAGLCIGHAALGIALVNAKRRGGLTSPTLVVGAGRVGHLVARRLLERPQLGARPVGFLDNDPVSEPARAVDLPVLGSSHDLERVVEENQIAYVVIAFSTASDESMLSIARRCGDLGVGVSVVPRLFEVEGTRPSAIRLGGLPLVELPFDDPTRLSLRFKYALDRVLGGIMWIVSLPLLSLIALAVRVTMGGPVLHRQDRVGRHGEPFVMLKFRTMSGRPDQQGEADAAWLQSVLGVREEDGSFEVATDRTTPLGRLLRRTSLDELPQLWNVVRGDMSLVGPRPERVSYVDRLSPIVYRYPERHRVKPGMTGWAQVHGLRGRTSLEDRVEWDNYYVENWSWGLDLIILGLTARTVLRGPEEVLSEPPVRVRRGFRQPFRAAQRLFGLLVLIVVFMVSTSPALATLGSGTPSAADQYVEDVPTTTGAKPAEGTDADGTGGSSESGVAIWLLVALAATTLAGLGTAGYERRQHRRVGF